MKRILGSILVILLFAGLCACGKDGNGTTDGKSRNRNKETGTPALSETATPSPTEEVTPSPTEDPKQQLPVPDVLEGPPIVIGRGEGCDWYSDFYVGPVFDSAVDYLYLTEGGFDGLAAALRAQNLEAYRKSAVLCENAGAMLSEITEPIYNSWYDWSYIDITRNDSKVLSYTRTNFSWLDGVQSPTSRSGYTFNAETGGRLDLWTIIRDSSAFAGDLVTLFGQSASEPGFYDNWKERLTEYIGDGALGWACTDDGLIVWCNTGVLAPDVVGEVAVSYNVTDYPDRFNPAFIGAYGDYEPRPRYTQGEIGNHDGWEYYRSEQYGYLIRELAKGVGVMAWEDLMEVLRDYGIELSEGYNDAEARAKGMNAYAVFYDKEFKDCIRVQFCPEEGYEFGSDVTQRIESVTVTMPDAEYYLLIYAVGRNPEFRYQVIDCSFDGNRDYVNFDTLDRALDVMIVTFPDYYSDLKK